jgi:hypothetical protein
MLNADRCPRYVNICELKTLYLAGGRSAAGLPAFVNSSLSGRQM